MEHNTGWALTRSVARYAVFVVLSGVVLFASAGDLGWGAAWLYLGLYVVLDAVATVVTSRAQPELLVDRVDMKPNTAPWDRLLAPCVSFVGPVFCYVVAGFDYRLGWSPAVPETLWVASVVVACLGFALTTWAMVANRFFAATVRLQSERGHEVVTTGPYRYVRHPGYLGAVAFTMATPLILGSAWALAPAAGVTLLHLVRTHLEDRLLREQLPGYEEYAGSVRYRLLPGLW